MVHSDGIAALGSQCRALPTSPWSGYTQATAGLREPNQPGEQCVCFAGHVSPKLHLHLSAGPYGTKKPYKLQVSENAGKKACIFSYASAPQRVPFCMFLRYRFPLTCSRKIQASKYRLRNAGFKVRDSKYRPLNTGCKIRARKIQAWK